MSESTVYFCPSCGAATVAPGIFDATCMSCGWRGPTREALSHTFTHTFFSDESAHQTFSKETQLLVAKHLAEPMLRHLTAWGFIEVGEPVDALKTKLARYIKNAAEAVTSSIVATRADIEKEAAEKRSKLYD